MSRFQSYIAVAVVLSLFFCGKALATLTINFDPTGDLPASLSAMGNSPGSAVPTGSELSNQYEADGVLFSSSSSFVAVVNNGASSASSPNGIGGVTAGGLLSYADPVTFTFVQPGTTTPGVTSNLSIQADSIGIPGQYAKLSAYDIHGTLLDSVTLNDVGGEVWSISMSGIHSAQFIFPTTSAGVPTTGSAYGSGTGIELDDLSFGRVTAVAPVVPLPAAAWNGLVLLGLLAVMRGLQQRRASARQFLQARPWVSSR